MNPTRSKPLCWSILLLSIASMVGLPLLGCGALFQKTVEVAKDKTASLVEDKAKAYGLDLKEKYGIDPVTDTPQVQVLKIIKTEAQAGHGELAALLADVEKTKTLGDAIQLVVTYQKWVSDKEKQGLVKQEAVEAANRIATGLGGLLSFSSLAGLVAALRGKKYKDAALLIMEKVEEARIKNRPADSIVEEIGKTNGPRKTTAALVEELAIKHFPNSTEMQRAQYLAGELAKQIAAGQIPVHPTIPSPLPSI